MVAHCLRQHPAIRKIHELCQIFKVLIEVLHYMMGSFVEFTASTTALHSGDCGRAWHRVGCDFHSHVPANDLFCGIYLNISAVKYPSWDADGSQGWVLIRRDMASKGAAITVAFSEA